MQFSKKMGTGQSPKHTFLMVGRDVAYAAFGLLISILLAIGVNPNLQEELITYFGL